MQLRAILDRPGMWAAGDGRVLQPVAMGALSDLCFIDDRDDEYERAKQWLYRYGKLGVVGAFRAVFGDECGYVAEVASVFAQLPVGCGYVEPEHRLSDDGWRSLHGEVLERYWERDVRLSEVRKDLGPCSLLIDGRVVCYVGPGANQWLAFDCWEPSPRMYDSAQGHFRTVRTKDPMVCNLRIPSEAFNESLILTPLGKALRWGDGWRLRGEAGRDHRAPNGVVEQLQAIRDGDPSSRSAPGVPEPQLRAAVRSGDGATNAYIFQV